MSWGIGIENEIDMPCLSSVIYCRRKLFSYHSPHFCKKKKLLTSLIINVPCLFANYGQGKMFPKNHQFTNIYYKPGTVQAPRVRKETKRCFQKLHFHHLFNLFKEH
jgi:hypothetical protein